MKKLSEENTHRLIRTIVVLPIILAGLEIQERARPHGQSILGGSHSLLLLGSPLEGP